MGCNLQIATLKGGIRWLGSRTIQEPCQIECNASEIPLRLAHLSSRIVMKNIDVIHIEISAGSGDLLQC